MNLKMSVEYNHLQLLAAQRQQKMLKLYEKIHKRKSKDSYVV
jgi:aminoglycoside/choline kinase family phosphotransferase